MTQLSSARRSVLYFCVVLVATLTYPTPCIGNEAEGFIKALKRAIARSIPRLEWELYDHISKHQNPKDDDHQRDDEHLLAKWLLGDIGLKDDVQLRLVTVVWVFVGTTEDKLLSPETKAGSEPNVHGKYPSVYVVIRMPQERGVPSATIVAVVEVQNGDQQVLYSSCKVFEYRNRWVAMSSKVEKR